MADIFFQHAPFNGLLQPGEQAKVMEEAHSAVRPVYAPGQGVDFFDAEVCDFTRSFLSGKVAGIRQDEESSGRYQFHIPVYPFGHKSKVMRVGAAEAHAKDDIELCVEVWGKSVHLNECAFGKVASCFLKGYF